MSDLDASVTNGGRYLNECEQEVDNARADLDNAIRERHDAGGITVAALAKLAGVTRVTVYAALRRTA